MKRKRLIYLGGFLLFLALLIAIYLRPVSRYRELKNEEERLSRQIREMGEKITKLEEERELLKTDVKYLEKVIRQEMGLVKPGEVIYKVIEEPAEKPAEEPLTT